jgi:microcystin degradation protein MlrC
METVSGRRRVPIAGLFHETHTFVDDSTPASAFEFRRGEKMLECSGDASPLGGALELARDLGWQVEPLLDARAVPSGTVEDEVFESYWREFRARAEGFRESDIEGVLLILHGAMVTHSLRDVEGELLRRIREELGWSTIPIVAVLDLHANVTPLMAQHASGLVSYRENPHSDARDTACRAARLLDQTMQSRVAIATTWKGTQIMWPPGGTGTASSPMADLEALARTFEQATPGVLVVNVSAGFSFADTPETGVSFSVVEQVGGASAGAILDSLAAKAWELREAGNVCGITVEEALERVRSAPAGLVVLAEESDNIGGGAPGDGTGLLRALIAHEVESAAVCLTDPEAVRALADLPIGESKTLPIGGRGSRYDEGPLAIEVTVRHRTDGRFNLEDKRSHLASVAGDSFDMGPSVLVEHRGVLILLTSHRTPPMDLGQWKSVGVDPATLRVIGVKAAIAHRRAYDPIAVAHSLIDTPGPCRGDLRRLEVRHIRRPVFPLDPFS